MWASACVTVASMFLLVAFHVFAAQSAFTLEHSRTSSANEQLRYERLRERGRERCRRRDTVIDGPRTSSAWCRARPSSSSRCRRRGAAAETAGHAARRESPVQRLPPDEAGPRRQSRDVPARRPPTRSRPPRPRAPASIPAASEPPRAAQPARRSGVCSALLILGFGALAARVGQLQVAERRSTSNCRSSSRCTRSR